MQWDPFLMEVLLKKEVCGSREQCTKPTGKLKKKRRLKHRRWAFNQYPKGY